MADEKSTNRLSSVDRRKFIAGVAAGATASVAGCGSDSEPEDEGQDDTPQGTPTETPAGEDIPRGGTPIGASAQPPTHINVFKTTGSGSFEPYWLIYTYGATPHPNSGKPIPWGFSDWELTPENVGTGDPTIVAEVRDGLTWDDGNGDVTAEDVAFTYNYMMEQQTAVPSPREEVEAVDVDSPDGSTVNFYLSEKTAVWNTQILTIPFVPKHIWKDVADFSQYSPREEGTLVGSSPLKFVDYSWDSWFEWEMRPDDEFPDYNQEYDFLHDDGPFIDGWRHELFQSQSAMFEALTSGRVHASYEGVTIDEAITAQDSDRVTVESIEQSDFTFHAWNMRRVPFDDRAFRQFLSKALNRRWLVEGHYQGIGAEKGSYSTSTMYDEWRPPEPETLHEEHDGVYEGVNEDIEIPDLSWPSDSAKYGENTPEEDIDALRSFLIDHGDAKREYSLGPAVSDEVDTYDDQEIYIDGQPIPEVHTNNDGEAGQGPLEMSMGPPETDALKFARSNGWVTTLNRIGIPVERALEPWETQYPKIYINEDFDMYEQDWGNNLVWPQNHIEWQFHSASADLDGTEDDLPMWNSMTYANSDDIIAEAMSLMDHEERKPLVKEVFARVYRDSPNMVAATLNMLFPVSNEFNGYVINKPNLIIGDVMTPLNVRKASED